MLLFVKTYINLINSIFVSDEWRGAVACTWSRASSTIQGKKEQGTGSQGTFVPQKREHTVYFAHFPQNDQDEFLNTEAKEIRINFVK
jgi:hypothetical protein